MKIVIGCDHAALELKNALKKSMVELGHMVEDVGTNTTDSVDYPDYAAQVAKRVVSGEAQRGVLCCGSGIGMAIAANKVPGARAVVLHSEWEAEYSRRHNAAKIACFGARQHTAAMAERWLKVFLATEFEGGRHQRRVEKICGLDGTAKPAQWAAGGDA
ncbi:ribose 5-phosphate isomerase B [Planctomycetaceae bacterium]|nr:ribose 5-phosphate isomerase B [Planctomycetaceae bacterium]